MASSGQRMAAMLLAFAASTSALSPMNSQGCFSTSTLFTKADTYQYQSSGHCGPLCANNFTQPVAALTNGNECWCGSEIPASSLLVSDSYCSDPCTGFGNEKCGGSGYFTVWTSGLTDSVSQQSGTTVTSSSVSSSSSTASPTSTPSTFTSVSPGSTILVTVSASATSTPTTTTTTAASSSSKTSVAGIAAGVVVGVIAVAAIIGGVFFWLRHRRRQQAEEDYKRSAQVQDFMRNSERKAPNTAYSNMSDSRLDPETGRRNSVGSMADDHDYSRRILRVANPDSP